MLKTNAFVLRRQDFREYDRIYTIYSEEYGKISLLARGARKIKSKLAAHLENFGEVRLNFAKGKIFNHLSGANVISFNKGLLNDGEKISFVSDCFYLLDRFIKPEEGDARIYDLMKEAFGAIAGNFFSPLGNPRGELEGGFSPPPNLPSPSRENGERLLSNRAGGLNTEGGKKNRDALQKIRVYFFWRFIDLLGYRPQLDECALCGHPSRVIPAPFSVIPVSPSVIPAACPAKPEGRSGKAGIQAVTKFNITDNIIICGECIGDGVFIQDNTLENLRKIFQSNLTEFLETDLDTQLSAITEKARQIKLNEL